MERNLTLIITCPMCGRSYELKVNAESYDKWLDGELAQNAFDYLTTIERESIISGLCSECQDEIFGSDEDEEADEEPYEYGPDDLEMGFNPYMGAYDYDC